MMRRIREHAWMLLVSAVLYFIGFYYVKIAAVLGGTFSISIFLYVVFVRSNGSKHDGE